MKVKYVGTATMVGGRNCFNVRCDDGDFYHVANMYYENFKELVAEGKLDEHCNVKKVNKFAVEITDPFPKMYERKRQCPACMENSPGPNECKEIFDEYERKNDVVS